MCCNERAHGLEEIWENTLLSKNVGVYFEAISRIKKIFWTAPDMSGAEAFYFEFIARCEESELLRSSLMEEYLFAHAAYRGYHVVDYLADFRLHRIRVVDY